jgi:hypothetical protein
MKVTDMVPSLKRVRTFMKYLLPYLVLWSFQRYFSVPTWICILDLHLIVSGFPRIRIFFISFTSHSILRGAKICEDSGAGTTFTTFIFPRHFGLLHHRNNMSGIFGFVKGLLWLPYTHIRFPGKCDHHFGSSSTWKRNNTHIFSYISIF